MNKPNAPITTTTNKLIKNEAKSSNKINPKGSLSSVQDGNVEINGLNRHSATNSENDSCRLARSSTSLQEEEEEVNADEEVIDDGKYVDTSSGGSENTTAMEAKQTDMESADQHHKIIESLKQKQSMSANKKFQRLFGHKIKDSNERLISVFRCALLRNNRHLLLQGILYVTRKHFAFHSNIFGYQTLELEKWSDIKEIKKENIALLFPTAISFTTHSDKKYFFASFLYRNQAFKILTKIWHHHNQDPDAMEEKIDHGHDLKAQQNGVEIDQNNNHISCHGNKNPSSTDLVSSDIRTTSNAGGVESQSRASSTSMSSMSSSSPESTELFVDSYQVDDEDAFHSEDDSSDMNSKTSSQNIGIMPQSPTEYPIKRSSSSSSSASLASKITSSMANLAQSLVYFFILNRVNMFFFQKIQLFIQYLFMNQSYNQSYHQRRQRSSSRETSAAANNNNNNPRNEARLNGTFLSSRYFSIKSLRIYYSELLILVTFLIVVLVLYVYIFLILIKVNTIESKLADLYEKLQSF